MLAIIDYRAPMHVVEGLLEAGHEPLKLPANPALPRPVSAHPDMNLFFAPDRILCTESYAQLAHRELERISKVSEKPIVTVAEEVGDTYPRDILLNAAPVGEFLLCHGTHTAKELQNDPHYRPLHVRQGYAKCSTVVVGDHAIISADPTILDAAQKAGLSTLAITPAHVELEGYDTGFLGGATSLAPYEDIPEIYFCGDLAHHPSADEIASFCTQFGHRARSLSREPLTDVGTIFLI